MKELELGKAFTLIEPGPVTMITTSDGGKDNIMTLSWHVVLGFEGRFAIMTGPWNYSFHALTKNKECVINIPPVELIEKAVGVGTTSGSRKRQGSRRWLARSAAGAGAPHTMPN